MNCPKTAFLLAILLSINTIVNCQTPRNLELATNSEDYKTQERVLLTIDQDFYLAGETINFGALTFDAAFQIPVTFSSIIYVELLDQDNNTISAKKYLLSNGETMNQLVIPRQLKTGYYYLRAYTNYMKNFGPACFFVQRLKILNPFFNINYSDDELTKASKLELSTSFEGGKLLYNTENKIAFHCPDYQKRILARLYKNDSIISEVDTKNGFGTFVFTPNEDSKYRIEAVSVSEKKTVIELNDIKKSGAICKLDSTVNSVAFIQVNTQQFDQFPLSVFVENNQLHYEYPEKLRNPNENFSINLPVGLNEIIIKNIFGSVVSTRLVYIKPHANFNITAGFVENHEASVDSFLIKLSSDINDTLQYIVAMTLGSKNTATSLSNNIESALYSNAIASLSNTISINELNFIGNKVDDINNYLLKFTSPKNKDEYQAIKYLPEINCDIVTGRITSFNNSSIVANREIYLAFVDSISILNRSKTDSTGKFIAKLPLYYQGTDLFIGVQDNENEYNVNFDDEFHPDYLPIIKENFYPDSSLKELIESRMLNLQITDAYADYVKHESSPRSNLRFYGYPSSEYNFRKYVNLPNLEEFIFEIVKEAAITRKDKQVSIVMLAENQHNVIGGNPLILLDGIPVFNTDMILKIPTEKLQSIRLVSSKFYFGTNIYDGLVDITSNSKAFDLIDKDKNSARMIFNPTITEKPKYQPVNNRVPNYNSTIFSKKINSGNGVEIIKLPKPKSQGNYMLNIFGYTKTGKWSTYNVNEQITTPNN